MGTKEMKKGAEDEKSYPATAGSRISSLCQDEIKHNDSAGN